MKTKEQIFKTAYARQRMKGGVTGTGDIDWIRRRYRTLRRIGASASNALHTAIAGTVQPAFVTDPCIGAVDDRGYRCVTKPQAFGLRFVDYSDEIKTISHQGWYTDTEGRDGEVYRGVVWQLPGKDKRARYIAGYHDMAGDCYILDFRNIFVAIPRDHPSDSDDVLDDAARAGDREAERDAEKCRDYDHKWQAANRWQELHDTLTGIECQCISAEDERDRLREKIGEIEREFLDIAEFARNNL